MGARARPRRIRIGELERRSGCTRDMIHHYLRLGLLPEPERTGRTTAWFDARHEAALTRVRALLDAGHSLTDAARMLSGPLGDAPLRDLTDVARLLAPDGRAVTVRDDLGPDALALLRALDVSPGDALPPGALAAARALGHTAHVDALRRALEAMADARAAALRALLLEGSPDRPRALREHADALGSLLDGVLARRASREAGSLVTALFEARRAARRSPWLALSPAAHEGATLRLVVIDRALSERPGDVSLHAERARLVLGVSTARRAGEVARASRELGVRDAWVSLAAGADALSRDDDAAEAHLDEALALRPGWALATAMRSAAALWRARGGALLDALPWARRLAAVAPSPDDAVAWRLRTAVVVARTLAALPAELGVSAGLAHRVEAALAEASAVGPHELSRGTGELARAEGNAWLALGDLRRAEGRDPMEAWERAAGATGQVAHAARARLRGDASQRK